MSMIAYIPAFLALLTPPLILAWHLSRSETYNPRIYRAVAVSSALSPLAPLPLIASGGLLREALLYTGIALAAGYAVLVLVALHFERRSLGVVTVDVGGGVRFRARLLPGERPLAFTLAGLGRVYISRGMAGYTPRILCSIVAHEYGHISLLEPIPSRVWYMLLIAPTALLIYTLFYRAAESVNPTYGIVLTVLLLGLALAWVAFSWSWELYADYYAARTCGASTVAEALWATSAAQPCRKGFMGILAEMLRSLRPVRVWGVSLSNPHPPSCLRLSLALGSAPVKLDCGRASYSL